MKEKMKFGFESRGYIAPRAENVGIDIEGFILGPSMEGDLDNETVNVINNVGWDGSNP